MMKLASTMFTALTLAPLADLIPPGRMGLCVELMAAGDRFFNLRDHLPHHLTDISDDRHIHLDAL